MATASIEVFFDFVDPLSYLLACELRASQLDGLPDIRWYGYEMRPPPTPLTTLDESSLASRWTLAREAEVAVGIAFGPPRLVPWTRKAHELALHAGANGVGDVVRDRIFEAYLLEGADIGRVDVLVRIAREAGLDETESKAVLDVDRFETEVLEHRSRAKAQALVDTPLLIADTRHLQGFHNRTALGTFLHV
jgi:predicted DsbA family dithiol-disulfide isomerase